MGQQVKRRIEMKNRHLAVKIISYVILSAGAVMMVLPFYWMIITAFKTPELAVRHGLIGDSDDHGQHTDCLCIFGA